MFTPKNNELLNTQMRDILMRGFIGKICIGYQALSVTTSAVVNLTVPKTATSALITVDSQGVANTNATTAAVRYTEDGTSPATGTTNASAGIPLAENITIEIQTYDNLVNAKFIAGTATNILKVLYYK